MNHLMLVFFSIHLAVLSSVECLNHISSISSETSLLYSGMREAGPQPKLPHYEALLRHAFFKTVRHAILAAEPAN